MDNSFMRRWRGPWGQRKTVEAVAVGVALLAAFSVFTASTHRIRKSSLAEASTVASGPFPAIFNFGDSNSDTGSVSAAFGRCPPPNGMTFFGKPSGRYSDGRLIVDFIAEKLGLPYLSAYLDSIATNFSQGANFAASGASIQPVPTMNPIHLGIQLSQFEQFKERAIELYNQGESICAKSSLPRPEDFSKALYTMDIGQNDLHARFTSVTEEQVEASIPGLIDQFSGVIEKLYRQGAKAFWIHNTGPIGCLPYFVINYPPKPNNSDQNGCIKSYNEVAQVFNKQLKDRIYQLKTKFQDASLIYVDIFNAKYSLISEAKEHGFIDPLGHCCGHHGDYIVDCGQKKIVNGTEVYGASCSNPSEYINWDGIHYTEAANHWISHRVWTIHSLILGVGSNSQFTFIQDDEIKQQVRSQILDRK
ncbi:GDSL-like Lipase/Acylhydrolase superfamily protein [Actinidia rufa]|uniref:GDSL-like Lipase/Acylhydrolase superfamily protein n=1 Tax=Actinidia rufa TaxID=165716 RepID=A0A7J0EP08_9ERIC|nr:GDSL-like Lipase/Acylhydrolase superfamily protein [Actinidia rufa]